MPQWTKNIDFPEGTVVFKLLYANATTNELPILKGAPIWEGVCYSLASDTYYYYTKKNPDDCRPTRGSKSGARPSRPR